MQKHAISDAGCGRATMCLNFVWICPLYEVFRWPDRDVLFYSSFLFSGAPANINCYIDGLVKDCSNSSALALELLQSCTIYEVSFL